MATARIWSVTATAGRPAQSIGTRRGGLGCGEVESGTTITVLRCWLRTLVVSTRQGRVFLISAPRTGSSWTHQTSPRWGPRWGPCSGLRRGVGPRLGDLAGDGVEFFFNGTHLGIPVGNFTRPEELAITTGQLIAHGLRYVPGTLTRRDSPEEQRRQVFRQCERHLSVCHRTILPYSRSWLGALDRSLSVAPASVAPARRP